MPVISKRGLSALFISFAYSNRLANIFTGSGKDKIGLWSHHCHYHLDTLWLGAAHFVPVALGVDAEGSVDEGAAVDGCALKW